MFYVWLAVLGAVGVLIRFGVVGQLNTELFPFGTLTVNVLGSLLIGALYSFQNLQFSQIPPALVWVLSVGLLGGLTTFSSYSLETIKLLEMGKYGQGLANICISNVLCLMGCYLGIRLVRWKLGV